MSTIKNFTLWVRKRIEVNTDPQRRCYYGCHARSEMVWTAWGDILNYETLEAAEDTMMTFKRINPTHQYKILPYGQRPGEEQA